MMTLLVATAQKHLGQLFNLTAKMSAFGNDRPYGKAVLDWFWTLRIKLAQFCRVFMRLGAVIDARLEAAAAERDRAMQDASPVMVYGNCGSAERALELGQRLLLGQCDLHRTERIDGRQNRIAGRLMVRRRSLQGRLGRATFEDLETAAARAATRHSEPSLPRRSRER